MAPKTEEPPAKKAKTDEEAPKEEEKKEEPKEEVEKEQDAPNDPRAGHKKTVAFESADTTLNVMPTSGGKMLMALTDGGMQYLLSGARANVGVKSGRYLYEVKVVEALNIYDGEGWSNKKIPAPRQTAKVGFSLDGSALLADADEFVGFDQEGNFLCGKEKKRNPRSRFGKDTVVGLLLNMDAKSPNANTVSLFLNGKRMSEPHPLPDGMKGKALFPHIVFRNFSVQTHFGPQPLSPLPFKCTCLGSAAKDDVQVKKPHEGKYEALFPVGFPDEGTFEWLDDFLAKNKQYTELSDRMIQDWAVKSGFWASRKGNNSSEDRPDYQFGVRHMDDGSAKRAIYTMASLVPRNVVVMEVKGNLVAADRAENLKKLDASNYKRIAHVAMGEPPAAYKEKTQAELLEAKQKKREVEWTKEQVAKKLAKKRKEEEEARKKQIAERQKQLAELQKKRLEEAKKKKEEEEAKKKAEEAPKEGDVEMKEEAPKEGEEAKKEEAAKEDAPKEEAAPEEAKKEEEEKKEEEKKEETKEEKKDEDESMEPKKEEEEEVEEKECPKVELTEDEKKITFKKQIPGSRALPDIAPAVLSHAFGDFSIPKKAEGFDAINFHWSDEKKSTEYLSKWVLNQKIISRIDDLKPGEWFTKTNESFKKTIDEWKEKQKGGAKKEEKKEEEEKKEGEEKKDEEMPDADKKDEEKKEEEVVEKGEVDIMKVDDVTDVGDGETLFANFAFEDWALFNLRCEFYLLMAAYKKDVNDDDRVGIHKDNFSFYYNKYFRKQLLNPKLCNKETFEDVLALIKDTAVIDESNGVYTSKLQEDPGDSPSYLLKLTEGSRRERQRRIDAGDETVRLNFSELQKAELANRKAQALGYGSRGGGSWQQRDSWKDNRNKGGWQDRRDAGKGGGGGGGSWGGNKGGGKSSGGGSWGGGKRK